MSKYDKYIEDGRKNLDDYANEWKSLIEEIKSKESEKGRLEGNRFILESEIIDLEKKLKALESAPKKKLKVRLSMMALIVFMVLVFVISANAGFVTEEVTFIDAVKNNLVFNIWMIAGATLLGISVWNADIIGTKKLEKEYTVESLTEEINEKKQTKSLIEGQIREVTSELDKLYGEREELKNLILELHNNVRELESQRLIVIESLVPNLEPLLDASFDESYKEECPLGAVRTRRKEKDKKEN